MNHHPEQARPVNNHDMASGPGLFEIGGPDRTRHRHITNMRRLAGTGRAPGSVLIGAAAWLLVLIGGGALYVSFTAQQRYVFAARHQNAASIIEALLLDLMMIVFTLLALGLSRAGKPSRTERALILVSAAASAYMNVAAADVKSPRSVTAYILAPLALAVVVDRVVAVIRRHVLADEEPSAWAVLGRATTSAMRLACVVALYTLRFILAAPSTARGVRRAVLQAAPLPPASAAPAADGDPASPAPSAEADGRYAYPAGVPGVPGPHPAGVPGPYPSQLDEYPSVPGPYPARLDPIRAFTPVLAAGRLPSIRQIRGELSVGQDKAQEIQAYLKTMLPEETS